jgi:coenzyme PQQ precursor peptide PqqA
MAWTTPDFVEITLCMEVTAYVNTDEAVHTAEVLARAVSPDPVPAVG